MSWGVGSTGQPGPPGGQGQLRASWLDPCMGLFPEASGPHPWVEEEQGAGTVPSCPQMDGPRSQGNHRPVWGNPLSPLEVLRCPALGRCSARLRQHPKHSLQPLGASPRAPGKQPGFQSRAGGYGGSVHQMAAAPVLRPARRAAGSPRLTHCLLPHPEAGPISILGWHCQGFLPGGVEERARLLP